MKDDNGVSLRSWGFQQLLVAVVLLSTSSHRPVSCSAHPFFNFWAATTRPEVVPAVNFKGGASSTTTSTTGGRRSIPFLGNAVVTWGRGSSNPSLGVDSEDHSSSSVLLSKNEVNRVGLQDLCSPWLCLRGGADHHDKDGSSASGRSRRSSSSHSGKGKHKRSSRHQNHKNNHGKRHSNAPGRPKRRSKKSRRKNHHKLHDSTAPTTRNDEEGGHKSDEAPPRRKKSKRRRRAPVSTSSELDDDDDGAMTTGQRPAPPPLVSSSADAAHVAKRSKKRKKKKRRTTEAVPTRPAFIVGGQDSSALSSSSSSSSGGNLPRENYLDEDPPPADRHVHSSRRRRPKVKGAARKSPRSSVAPLPTTTTTTPTTVSKEASTGNAKKRTKKKKRKKQQSGKKQQQLAALEEIQQEEQPEHHHDQEDNSVATMIDDGDGSSVGGIATESKRKTKRRKKRKVRGNKKVALDNDDKEEATCSAVDEARSTKQEQPQLAAKSLDDDGNNNNNNKRKRKAKKKKRKRTTTEQPCLGLPATTSSGTDGDTTKKQGVKPIVKGATDMGGEEVAHVQATEEEEEEGALQEGPAQEAQEEQDEEEEARVDSKTTTPATSVAETARAVAFEEDATEKEDARETNGVPEPASNGVTDEEDNKHMTTSENLGSGIAPLADEPHPEEAPASKVTSSDLAAPTSDRLDDVGQENDDDDEQERVEEDNESGDDDLSRESTGVVREASADHGNARGDDEEKAEIPAEKDGTATTGEKLDDAPTEADVDDDDIDVPLKVDGVDVTIHINREKVSVHLDSAEEEDDDKEVSADPTGTAAATQSNVNATQRSTSTIVDPQKNETTIPSQKQALASEQVDKLAGQPSKAASADRGEPSTPEPTRDSGSSPEVADSDEDDEEDVDTDDEDEEEDEDETDETDEDTDDGDMQNERRINSNVGFSGGALEDSTGSSATNQSSPEARGANGAAVDGGKRDLASILDCPPKDSDIKVSVVTWNLAESSPSEAEATFFRRFRGSDLVLIGGQECENIKPRRSEGHRSREFRRLMIKMLGKKYVPLGLHLLGGIQFGLFCKRSILNRVEFVNIADVTCGIGNVFHNKGAIGAFVKLKASKDSNKDDESNGDKKKKRAKSLKMLFVTAHMAAHVKNSEARDADFWRIVQELEAQAPHRFLAPNPDPEAAHHGCGSYLLDSMDRVFFCGDLNYRINLPREEAEYTVEQMKKAPKDSADDLRERLLRHDQLLGTMAERNAFTGLTEGKIAFLPTFKFDKGTPDYDTSHKQRIPAWTDRVVYKPSGTQILEYDSAPEAMHSDHRPVFASFRVNTIGSVLPNVRQRKRRPRRDV